jgi:hypothetical protein
MSDNRINQTNKCTAMSSKDMSHPKVDEDFTDEFTDDGDRKRFVKKQL